MFHGRKTSSGDTYDMYAMTAAHPSLPIPSYVRVTNLANGRSAVVRVNDRGPFHPGRIIDLSYAAAYKLGYTDQGHANVESGPGAARGRGFCAAGPPGAADPPRKAPAPRRRWRAPSSRPRAGPWWLRSALSGGGRIALRCAAPVSPCLCRQAVRPSGSAGSSCSWGPSRLDCRALQNFVEHELKWLKVGLGAGLRGQVPSCGSGLSVGHRGPFHRRADRRYAQAQALGRPALKPLRSGI
jgi:rare lipoprotein A